MNNIANRVSQIQGWIEKQNLNALIISHADEYLSEYVPPENERLAWATGFTGSAGLAIITSDKKAVFVDGRYTVQVKEQVDSSLYETLHIKDNPWTKWIEQNLQSNAKIGYDPRLHQASWEENAKKLLGDNKAPKYGTRKARHYLSWRIPLWSLLRHDGKGSHILGLLSLQRYPPLRRLEAHCCSVPQTP